MTDPMKRIAAWKAKATPERTKQVLEARQADMQARYEKVMTELCETETQVRTLLNRSGVHTSLYVPYLNYGRQLWKLSRQQEIAGPSFAMAADVLRDKWQARGLDRDVLEAIKTGVFSIGVPSGGGD